MVDRVQLGRVGLFLGIETFHWVTGDWVKAVQFFKEHRVDFAIIKVFDATNEWYGTQFPQIRGLFTANGIGVLPYGFMGTADGYDYNLDAYLSGALDLLVKYIQNYGLCCADIEGSGWSNRRDLGFIVGERVRNTPGDFYVSAPANPVDLGMVDSFTPMIGAVHTWMPMAYDNYLDSVWRTQYGQIAKGLTLAPTFDLGADFGPDDVVSITHDAGDIENRQVSYWEYTTATNDPTLFDQCVSALKGPKTVITVEMAQAFTDHWNSFFRTLQEMFPQQVVKMPPIGTGIYNKWEELYIQGHQLGPATSLEYNSVDWSGSPIVCQDFGSWRIEWKNGKGVAFGPLGSLE